MIGRHDWLACGRCRARFPEREAEIREDRHFEEFWGARVAMPLTFQVCPECSSEDLEAFAACPQCVEASDPEPGRALAGMDYCAACLRAEIANERAEEARA